LKVGNDSAWNNKKIVFVTGKGGVGKSLIAAGIARQQALAGKRVLLAEIGENSYYKDFWNLDDIGHEPQKVPKENFDVALWSGESCLREYVLFYLKVEQLYKLFFENKVMRSLVNVAPGLSEIAILGKITSGIREVGPPLPYDVIVVDTFATGHALALFRTPKGMMEAIRMGPMGHHSREILNVLQNQELTSYILVSLLEELPVVETLEFQTQLRADLGVETHIIENRVVKIPVADSELEKLGASNEAGLSEFALFLKAISEKQTRYHAQLVKQSSPVVSVPMIFSNKPKELVDRVAEVLSP
jgi:anion-transporting  ArsA/GET3 family ATPase